MCCYHENSRTGTVCNRAVPWRTSLKGKHNWNLSLPFLERFGQTEYTLSMALWNNQGVEQDHHALHKTFKKGACDQYATTSLGTQWPYPTKHWDLRLPSVSSKSDLISATSVQNVPFTLLSEPVQSRRGPQPAPLEALNWALCELNLRAIWCPTAAHESPLYFNSTLNFTFIGISSKNSCISQPSLSQINALQYHINIIHYNTINTINSNNNT